MSFSKEPLLFELNMYEKPAPEAKQFLIPTGKRTHENMAAYNEKCVKWMDKITKNDPHPKDVKRTTMHYERDGYKGRALVYRPATKKKKLPVIFFTHGGSFLFWTPEYYDVMCRNIAHEAGCVVVNMDFRQNIGDFYIPDMYEDIYAGYRAMIDQAGTLGIDVEKICTLGDSSGGQIAGGFPLMVKDRACPHQVKHRILMAGGIGFDVNEISNNNPNAGKTELMGAENVVKRGFKHFDECQCKYWSPFLDPHPEDCPPTTFICGAADYMWHDVSVYSRKLLMAGVDVNVRLFAGMVHGFYNGGCGTQAHDCWKYIGEIMKRYFG